MMQRSLFHESLNDALREVVRALGGTKKVGSMMRPEKPADEAGRWLADCLNPERRERLDPDQLLWLVKQGRAVNCHAAIDFMCDAAGYQQPDPVEPEDERAKLQREFVVAVTTMQQLAKQLERAGVMAPLKAVG